MANMSVPTLRLHLFVSGVKLTVFPNTMEKKTAGTTQCVKEMSS